MRKRPVASSIGSTATPSPKCCGRRSAHSPSRRAACNRSPCDLSCTANVSASPSSLSATGTSPASSIRRRSRPDSTRSTARRSLREPMTSMSRACSRRPTWWCSTKRPRRASRPTSPDGNSPCGLSCRSRSSASPRRHSLPRHCSRKPPTATAGDLSAPCVLRRACTRTGSSPTCVPTRCSCQPKRCRQPATKPPICTARSTWPTSRASTPTNPRMHRRHTRPSVRQATCSALLVRFRANSTPMNSRCTTSSGSARWHRRWPMRRWLPRRFD